MKTIKQFCSAFVDDGREYCGGPVHNLIYDIAFDKNFGKDIKTERGLKQYLSHEVHLCDEIFDAVPEFMIMYKESV